MSLSRSACALATLLAAACAMDPPRDGAPDAAPQAAADAAAPVEPLSLEARLLVISADGTEPVLGAIEQALAFQGTPYTLWIASAAPGTLTAAALSDGSRGRFQGVLLASGEVARRRGQPSALTEDEWRALRSYELDFGVRRAAFFTAPAAEYGLGAARSHDASRAPIAASLTPAGHAVFPYLAGGLTIAGVDVDLAFAADERTTPLLTDADGHALIAVRQHPDGRESLAFTFNGGPWMVHSIALAYGAIDWVTRGLFLGERRVFATAQVDDVFLRSKLFGGGTYRISGDDLRAVARWQQAVRRRPGLEDLTLTLAFNGRGTTGLYAPDTLTPVARELQAEFRWVSHTWSHQDLDATDYLTTAMEIEQNDALARAWPLDRYHRGNLVTPGHTGLANPSAMQAAQDLGIRFLISNTSRAGQDNPYPNVGNLNAHQPGLLEIPRHPCEIYFDVTTPDEQVVEYRSRHPDRDLGYEQILERESDALLRYMLVGDSDPWMFHQSNLRAYDGSRTLITDVLDRVLEKYQALYVLPVVSVPMDELGALVAARTGLHGSGARAIIVPGTSITLTADRDATVPVTGLTTADTGSYAGQPVARVRVAAGQSITLPLR